MKGRRVGGGQVGVGAPVKIIAVVDEEGRGGSIAAVNRGGKEGGVNPQLVVSTALERSRRKVDN